jgi:hypothetical protein
MFIRFNIPDAIATIRATAVFPVSATTAAIIALANSIFLLPPHLSPIAINLTPATQRIFSHSSAQQILSLEGFERHRYALPPF